MLIDAPSYETSKPKKEGNTEVELTEDNMLQIMEKLNQQFDQ